MSIVIAVLEKDKEISLFADRRIVYEQANYEGDVHQYGDIPKIYELTDCLSCGMTGDAKWGILLAQNLMKNHDKLPSEHILTIKNFNVKPDIHSTFILVGQYDDKDLFLFGYKTEGSDLFAKNESCVMIATSPIEQLDACLGFYKTKREMGGTIEYCGNETIKFASLQNPKYISKESNYMQIKASH